MAIESTNNPQSSLVITKIAADKINEKFDLYLEKNSVRPLGIRIGVNRDGCSGLSYGMEYVLEDSNEVPIVSNGLNLFVDEKSLEYLREAEIDFVENESSSGFIFNNPNEQCKCACGKSFCA